MEEPILVNIKKEDLEDIISESLENNSDLFLLNFKNYSLEESLNKIKNISESLINEKTNTYIILKDINEQILNTKIFLTLYDYSLVLDVKLFKI
jgi:hypothetical protein